METLTELEALRRRQPDMPAPGSRLETEALARFGALFAPFDAANIRARAREIYAPDVYFNDTLKTVRGIDALEHYLLDSAAGAEACRVEPVQTLHNPEGEPFLHWRMMIRFRRFKRGVDTWSLGISHLRLDPAGRIAYQQDYWNAADGLFQHIPLLGGAIRAIKRRL